MANGKRQMDESNETMTRSILICGVGGQGTVLAAKLIAQAALANGLHVRSAETIGMAQRGGSVTSHVRLGDSAYSPLISAGQADVMIAFEPCEAVRNISYLSPRGVIAVSGKVVEPVNASLSGKTYDGAVMTAYLAARASRVIELDTDKLGKELGSQKAANTLLLGAAAASGMLGVTLADLKAALRVLVKPEFIALNERALETGAATVNQTAQ